MNNDHREQAREIVEQFSLHKVQLIEPPTNRQYHFDFEELIDVITAALSSQDAEIKEALEGLRLGGCWCPKGQLIGHSPACLAARALWEKVANTAPTSETQPISKPLPRKSKKQQIADELAASDLGAQLAERDNIEWGHHDSLPRGEHVARMKRG